MKTPQITEALYQYLGQNNPIAHPILEELAKITRQRSDANMQISPQQGSFLRLLVELIQAKRIVEVGCFTGTSAICMASGLKAGGKLYTLDIDPETAEIACSFFERAGLSDRIEHRLGPALESLEQIIGAYGSESFDLAFIDADKKSYQAYYEACLQLLRPGGLILVDNVLWGGAVIDSTDQSSSTLAIRRFNEHVRQDERVTRAMIPVADGLYLAVKR